MTFLRSRSVSARATIAIAATLAGPVLMLHGPSAMAEPAQSSVLSGPTGAPAAAKPGKDPLVIAHRGASGYRPEHTLAAYRLAIRMGADYIEPDVVSTKDGVLVARHENEISGTTDVADRPRFASRKTTKTIDGQQVEGWFTEDFTLRELKTLRAVERLPQVRPNSARFDGRFKVPTIREVISMVQRIERRQGRTIGIAPETKHPTYFDSIGLSLEEPLVRTLHARGLNSRRDAVVLQSFEVSNLRDLNRMTRLPIAQLLSGPGAPYDQVVAGTDLTYESMRTSKGLKKVSRYADWVSPEKDQILPRNADGRTGRPTLLVKRAHRAGLKVVTWTLRAENQFMAVNFRRGTDPNAKGDLARETRAFLDAGVDAIFSDHPDIAVAARDRWAR